MNIQTTHGDFEWTAVDADTYDSDPGSSGDIVGHGATERAAINHLVEQLIDAAIEETVAEEHVVTDDERSNGPHHNRRAT